jgi:glutamate dehydrogenase
VCARVVGEGGNLGFTQLGRIEYALSGGPDGQGGPINTDSTDNVAGVNTSDHEVNIKILLGTLVEDGDMTRKHRNELLFEMQGAVAEQVLYDSYSQTQAISLALAQAVPMIDVHARLIRYLEQNAGLNRELEFLPSEDVIAERRSAHRGLLAPELAVVLGYCKIDLFGELLESDLPEDPYLMRDLERYFPRPLPERFRRQMRGHRLRREIIATVVANQVVDRAGTTFAFRLREETGAPPSILARAYTVAREVLDMWSYWRAVESLDNEIASPTQLEMLIEGRRLVERSTRWLARVHPRSIDIAATINYYKLGARLLAEALPDVLEGADRQVFEGRVRDLEGAGVPSELARRVAGTPSMVSLFDIVEVSATTRHPLEAVMRVYFRLGSKLELNWLRDRIIELPRTNRWQALARAALRDDLYNLYRELTHKVLDTVGPAGDGEAAIETWSHQNAAAIERALTMISEIKASRSYDMTTLPVALREERNLVRGGTAAGPSSEAEPATMAE